MFFTLCSTNPQYDQMELKAIAGDNGQVVGYGAVIEGIVLRRRGAESETTCEGGHEKIKELNERFLPPGVKVLPHLDRSDLVHCTPHTVMHNLPEGILLVV